MAPIWLCLDCEGVAYGWARTGSCIYCGESRVVGTDDVYRPDDNPTDYRLLFFHPSAWPQVEAAASLARQTPLEFLSEREQAPIILVRDEPLQSGKLILLSKDATEGKAGPEPADGKAERLEEGTGADRA